MAKLIGQSLGRYHILEQLGEGGMAVVYKAFDTRLETEVAVKVIRTESLPQNTVTRALKRFEREAKSLAKLNHLNIAKVMDYGEFEEQPYLVMPYLQGGTLKEKLQGKAMGWQEAAEMLIPIAKALGYAHQRGMIHRDIKPANILITETGEPLLTDFGVAKIIDDEATMDLTGTHATVGTPEYMAPEQVTAKTVDHRADIYALGVVFYEMVTGRKPFQADTPMAVLFKHASDPLPRPTQFVPKLPRDVENILLKALAKDPKNRYQSMGEFVVTLENLVQGKTSVYTKVTLKRSQQKKISREKNFSTKFPFLKRYLWFILGSIALVSIFLGWIKRDGNNLNSFFLTYIPTQTPIATSTLLPTSTHSPAPSSTSTLTPIPTTTFTPLPPTPEEGELLVFGQKISGIADSRNPPIYWFMGNEGDTISVYPAARCIRLSLKDELKQNLEVRDNSFRQYLRQLWRSKRQFGRVNGTKCS